jgi:hypothetical protein
MVWGLVRKAGQFLGEVHRKASHGVNAVKGAIEKVKGFGSKASQFLDNLGVAGQIVKKTAGALADRPIPQLGGRSARQVAQTVEQGVGSAERVLRGDREELGRLAQAGLSRAMRR